MNAQEEINKSVQKEIKRLDEMIIVVHAENKELKQRIKEICQRIHNNINN